MTDYPWDDHPWERRFLAAVPFLLFGLFATIFVYAAVKLFLPDVRAIP